MKQIRQTTWMDMLMLITSVIGMLVLHACGIPIFKGSANISPPFYIDMVEGDGVYNSIVLKHDGDEDYEYTEAIDEFSETNTPAVSWIYKKGSRPKYFFVLMYKRGISNKVYYMHLVDGSKTNKKKGVADYVDTEESLDNTEKYPVEYRTIVMEIIKGDWTINDDGDITIKDEGLSTTLTHSDIVSLVRYKESHYIERTEYKHMSKGTLETALSDKAKDIQHFVGEAVGIPLIRMGNNFTVESRGLHNGQFIQESDRTFDHVAAPCVGYLGKSVSPHLEWKGGENNSKYVVLAYMPMQRTPTGGVRNISQSIAAPYFAIWFQYNITATTLKRGDASDGENDETHKVTYEEEHKNKGKLTQNVYSRAYNELNQVYNTCNAEDSNIFVTRVRYDGPVSAPTTGRQYIRFVVFEVNDAMTVYRPDKQGNIQGNIQGDIQDNRDDSSKKTLSNGEAVSGSAVDKLVRNFIDYERETVRTNNVNIGTDTVKHKKGEVTIRGVAVLTFPMNAPSAP